MLRLVEKPFGKGVLRELAIDRPARIEKKAQKINEAGFTFEVCLIDGIVVLTLKHDNGYQAAQKAAPNGPKFLAAFDSLVVEYFQKLENA